MSVRPATVPVATVDLVPPIVFVGVGAIALLVGLAFPRAVNALFRLRTPPKDPPSAA